MLTKRIIPCLDVKDGETVKGVNFVDLRSAGDPVALAKMYSDAGADELVFLDITASADNRQTTFDWVERIGESLNIPFTVGGGVCSVDDARELLCRGADKIAINSAALNRAELINEMAQAFGSQCVVVAIDAKFDDGNWHVYSKGGRELTQRGLLEWALEAQSRGAGEILFTTMNGDGTEAGFEVSGVRLLSDNLTIPIIASGGAGSLDHFRAIFDDGHADAALAATVFHFGKLTITQVKEELRSCGIAVNIYDDKQKK